MSALERLDASTDPQRLIIEQRRFREQLEPLVKKNPSLFIAALSPHGVQGLDIRFFFEGAFYLNRTREECSAALPWLENATTTADHAIAEWESWPRLYDLILPLPLPRRVFEPILGSRHCLSPAVRVETLGEAEIGLFDSSAKVRTDWYCLRLATLGEMLVELPDPLSRLESTARQFLGLAISADIVDVREYLDWDFKLPYVAIEVGASTISDFANAAYTIPKPLNASQDELSAPECAVIAALTVPNQTFIDLKKDHEYPLQFFDDYSKHSSRFRQRLHEIGFVFRSEDLRVLAAAEWLFGSFSGSNEAVQMVQATTALETLLGGTDTENKAAGLTELLATRCAYLLASRHSERQQIYREVKYLYAERSRIVHSGERRLLDDTSLRRARGLSKRVLARELRFLTLADAG